MFRRVWLVLIIMAESQATSHTNTKLLLHYQQHKHYAAIDETSAMDTFSRWLNPQGRLYKYTVLLLIASVQLFLNVSINVPLAFESVLIDTLKIDVTQYALLCTVYSWPTVVLTIIGAVIVNQYIGCRIAIVSFMVVVCIGQALFALGAYIGVYWVMVASRIIVGIGGDIVFTTSDVFAARWFKGHEVSIAFGVVGTFCRIGSAGSLYINTFIYDIFESISDNRTRLGVALLFTVSYLGIGAFLSLILAIMDKRAERRRKSTANDNPHGKFSIKEILNFNINFWITSLICFMYLATYFPFAAFAQVFLVSKYGLSVYYANMADLLIFLVPVIAPLFGVLINWTGFNIYWSLGGILVACGTHLLYLLSNGSSFIPYLANSVLGLAYSCVNTALWSAPPLLVKDHQLVTAYSILEAGLNLGFAVTGVILGPLIDNYGYFVQELVFLFFFGLVIILTLFLIINLFHSSEGSTVNMSGWHRKKQRELNAYI